MSASPAFHGVEVNAGHEHLVADYRRADGCRVAHFLIPATEDAPAYFVTAQNYDVIAEELLRADQYDGELGDEYRVTERVAFSYDHGLDEGADGVVEVDGIAYVCRYADDVVCVTVPAEYEEAL